MHLSVALDTKVIHAGFGAYFLTAHDLVTDLGRAAREGRLDRWMPIYLALKILIIDEMGLPAARRHRRHRVLPSRQRPLRTGSIMLMSANM